MEKEIQGRKENHSLSNSPLASTLTTKITHLPHDHISYPPHPPLVPKLVLFPISPLWCHKGSQHLLETFPQVRAHTNMWTLELFYSVGGCKHLAKSAVSCCPIDYLRLRQLRAENVLTAQTLVLNHHAVFFLQRQMQHRRGVKTSFYRVTCHATFGFVSINESSTTGRLACHVDKTSLRVQLFQFWELNVGQMCSTGSILARQNFAPELHKYQSEASPVVWDQFWFGPSLEKN